MTMLPGKQAALVEKFSLIPDPQERLAAIIASRPRLQPLATDRRIDAFLVPGCASRVWVSGSLEAGLCRFATDSESPLVRGLVALLCELYDGAPPQEVVDFEPALFEQLGVADNLSPTRLNGLANVRKMIAGFAAAHVD